MGNDVFLLKQKFWCQQKWKMPTMYITCVCLCMTFAKRGRPWLRRHVHPGFDGLDLRCGWKMLYDQCRHLKIVSRYYKLYTQCSFVSRARHFFKSGFNNIARAVEWTRFEIDTKTPKVDTDTMASKWAEVWMATAKDRYWKPDLTEAEAGCDL